MQVGEIDDEAMADAVEDITDRAAEDHREREDVALRLFARHPEGDRDRDQRGDRDEGPALRVVAAREHRQRNAAILGPLQVEDRSEEHTSELQSLMRISYAVFCLKKKQKTDNIQLH